MTTSFQIVEAKPYHCGQMARLLRAEQGTVVALSTAADIAAGRVTTSASPEAFLESLDD